MRTGGMVITFHHNLDTGLPELACEPFTGAVVSLDLDTELAGESIIQCSCRRMDIQTARFIPASRRDNYYCRGLGHVSDGMIRSARMVDELKGRIGDRYHKVDLEAYSRHKYRPEKFTMYSSSVHPLSNQLPSRRMRTNSEGPEAAILPPSAKIYMPVHVDIFLVLKFII